MKYIYVVNVRLTGCNGGIINSIDSAYFDKDKAIKVANEMWDHRPENDTNYVTYVTGPILLEED